MSPNDTYPQHVVTAVIVAHDGATWLPRVLDALLEQTRPVQRVVAVDTGSRDRSGAVLSAKLGQAVVFGMDRATGYGAAVAKALAHRAANTQIPVRPGAGGAGEHVEWVWLLHDDCEPAADALEQLLRGAAETPKAAVLGPKVMDWADHDVLLEAGLTIDTVGRRVTGVEAREVDQGQHDGDRDTLAVSSAGMLVRRDVWDALHGFDPAMTLFREDMDFCWRVHAAGYRVRVVTDAVVFHAQAMSRRRRPSAVGRRGALLDRRNALLTLAGNLPLRPMLASLAGNVILSVLRALFFLVAKRVTAAMDEAAALASVLGHPLRLMAVRKQRARGRKQAYGRLRADIPPGRSVRRFAEAVSTLLSSGQQDTRGSHHAAMEDPDADDFLLTDSGIAQRLLTHPGVLLFLGLVIVTLIAERSVIGAGSLGGGALLPATQGAGGLWQQYLQGFHPSGIGSPSAAPPYLAVVAALATVLLGKAWLAVDVMLLGSVPIAGLAAFRAIRQVTASVPVRVWAAAAYALLPVATGAIAAGRLGSAAAFVAVPVIGLLAGRMLSKPPRLARRAAWATGLAVALGSAFVPLLWPISLLAGGLAAVALRAGRPALLRNLGIVAIVPPVLLLPWTFQLAAHPATLLLEVGAQQPGLAAASLPASSLVLLSPGGPGLPPYWVTAGLLLAALAALLSSRRRPLILAGWTVALLGLLVAALVAGVTVQPPAGGPPVAAWPGIALAVAAAGLLLAVAAAGDSLGAVLPGRRPGRSALGRLASGRGLGVAVLALAAAAAPAAAAGLWLLHGVSGPLAADSGQVVPPLVAATATGGAQGRTLLLRPSGAGVSYLLLRGNGPQLGDADLIPVPAAERALQSAVAALVAPQGGQAIGQARALARFDISYVLVRAPVNADLARALNGVVGLRPVSITSQFDIWRLTVLPSRVSVVESNGTVVPVRSGSVGASGTAPAAGGTLTLAEPAGGWQASLNGRPLTPVASPAGRWAAAFRLPAGGGTVQLSRGELGHDLGIGIELLATLAVGALALPGIRTAGEAPAGAAAAGAAGAGGAGAGAAGAGAAGQPAAGGSEAGGGAPAPVAVPVPAAAGSRSAGRRGAVPGRRDRIGSVGAVQEPSGRGAGRRGRETGRPAVGTPGASGPGASGLGAEAGLAGRRAGDIGPDLGAGADFDAVFGAPDPAGEFDGAGRLDDFGAPDPDLGRAGRRGDGFLGTGAGGRAGRGGDDAGRADDFAGAGGRFADAGTPEPAGRRGDGFLGTGVGSRAGRGRDEADEPGLAGPGRRGDDLPGAGRRAGRRGSGAGDAGSRDAAGRDVGGRDVGGRGAGLAAAAGAAGAAGSLIGAAADEGGRAGRLPGRRAAGRDDAGPAPDGENAGRSRGRSRRGRKAAPDVPAPRRAGRPAAADGYDSGAYDSAGFRFTDTQPGAGDASTPGRPSGPTAAWPGGLPDSEPPRRADSRPDWERPAGYRSATGAGPDFDSDPADRTAAFDSGALRGEPGAASWFGGGAADSTSVYDTGPAGGRGSGEYRAGDHREADAGYGRPDLGGGDYGRPDYGSADHRAGDGAGRPANYYGYGADEADAGPAGAGPAGAGAGGRGYAGPDYGRADFATAQFDSAPYESAPYDSRPPPGDGYGADGYAASPPDRSGYGDPGRRPAPDQGAGQPGQDAGRRSPTGAWPYPDESSAPGGPVPPADRISRARLPGESLPGDAQAGYGPRSGGYSQPGYPAAAQPQPGQPQPGQPQPGQYQPGRSAAGGSWDSPAAPGYSTPGARPDGVRQSQPGQTRPDPGWPDDRWQDARQPGPGGSPRPGDSGGWPQDNSGASWPDTGSSGGWPAPPAPSAWPAGGQGREPAAPDGWQPGGEEHWPPGADDSLEPLPSAEVHHHGGARPDERSRRRWPAPDAEDEETGTW